MILKSIIVLIVTFIFIGCSNPKHISELSVDKSTGLTHLGTDKEPYTGIAITEDEAGNIAEQRNYKKGLLDGTLYKWDNYNEKIYKTNEEEYVEGLLHGVSTIWGSNGVPSTKVMYKDGKKLMILTGYKDSEIDKLRVQELSKIKTSSELKKEDNPLKIIVKKGEIKRYFYNGKCVHTSEYSPGTVLVEIQESFKDNKLTGARRIYKDSTNELLNLSYYENGKKTGIETDFCSENRFKLAEKNWINGKKTGTETLFNSKGNILSTQEWSDGKKMGNYIEYNNDGKKSIQKVFLNNIQEDVEIHWGYTTLDGEDIAYKEKEIPYKKGEKHGKEIIQEVYRIFFKDESLDIKRMVNYIKRETNYKNGLKDGYEINRYPSNDYIIGNKTNYSQGKELETSHFCKKFEKTKASFESSNEIVRLYKSNNEVERLCNGR